MVTLAVGRSRLSDYVELTKPGIVALVLVTVAAGLYLGAAGAITGLLLFHALMGSTLVAAGSNALNQVVERDVDARMTRTRSRPIPAGRLTAAAGALVGGALGVSGVLYLTAFVNAPTAFLAAATLVSYVFVYTPLKRRTSLATLVGAVPGALPIVGGWTAARGTVTFEAGVLFALLFLWQLPHFLALAWIYRDDYARAGLRMLSVTDGGAATFRQALLYAVALLPVSLAPSVVGTAGRVYFFGAIALSLWFLWATVEATRHRSLAAARRLFGVSVMYLPAILVLMMADKV